MHAYFSLAGRLLLATLFLVSGINMAMSPLETAHYMQSVGLAGAFLWPTVAVEMLCGVAIAVGWFSRPSAFILAVFTLVAAFIFHSNFAGADQLNNFLKNLGIVGGLLYLTAYGPGRISISARMPTVPMRAQEPLPTA